MYSKLCGLLHGSLINIDTPKHNEGNFRHDNCSITCMVVCRPDLGFYYINADWWDSVHDLRVLRNSALHATFEEGYALLKIVIPVEIAYLFKE